MELFRLLGTVAIDTAQAEKNLEKVRSDVGKTGNDTENAFSKIGKAAGAIGKAVLAAGTVLGGAFVAAIEGSREYRNEMGLLDTAFQVQGHSSEAAKNTYSDLNAVMRDSGAAVEAAQHLALVADNEAELSDLTNTLTGVYATFGDSLPLEGLAEAINHSASLGEVQGSLADALEWSGITVDDFNIQLAECSTEEERQKLIMDTLRDTYSKAAEQYKETNKDVMDAEKANEALADAFAEIGRVGEPILTAIKEKVAEFVKAAIPHIENFIEKIKDLKKWIEENKSTIDVWVAVIVGATVSIGVFLLILNWGAIMTAAAKAVNTVRTAILAMNAAMLLNPIGLIIALIAGLVAAFIVLWNNNEGFRKFWMDMWDKVKSASGKAVDWIKDKFNALKDALGVVKTVFGGIKDTITEKIESAREAVKTAIDKIKGFFPLSIGKIFSNFQIPKITVSGGKAPYGIAGKGSLPSFDVKWNAEGGILDRPTIFGQLGDTLLGGGEAGKEAIAPIDVLQGYVKSAVQAENESIVKAIIEQNRILIDFLKRAIPKGEIRLDSGALVGALTPSIDIQLSDRWKHSQRGNTR